MAYLNIRLEGLRKTMKDIRQDIRSSGRNLKPGPPAYEVLEVLLTRPNVP
jgi:hypothetical protein